MHPYVRRVALLLFGSGFCALVYQVAWLRLLRLIFGSSTGASAAVLAIFMGGLGLGSYLLGRRGDRSPSPLGLYGNLELGISIAAAASPLLVAGVRAGYLALGGTYSLPAGAGLAVRMLLAAVVLGVPTFLMGGTLPAAVRSITRDADTGRHSVGLLYAVNTLGAVVGAMATNFLLIELLGIQRTIWLAALLNLLVAIVARAAARERGVLEPGTAEPAAAAAGSEPPGRLRLILAAAAIVGFVFFLMELVWYRMLAPILGGSTYTFGVVLAVALLGIGAGGLMYAVFAADRRPTARSFALTCALEAVLVALPFALGDVLAFLSLELRGLQALGFSALVTSWTVVCLVVVLPASLVAGYQFPLLVALLGSGRRRVARQVGLTYAWNTLGAIAGAIAGGFGLIPLLGAPGAWRLSVGLLVALSLLFLFADRPVRWRRAAATALVAATAVGLGLAAGPTSFWRHGGIGAGRMRLQPNNPNEVRDLLHSHRRGVAWEEDGRESSVALIEGSGYAFFVNGKSDGSARGDAPTQVMSGLVGTMLHPAPRTGLVIGLGTGSTAGWIADVEGMERVDVVELEPVIRRVAEDCAPVSRNALEKENLRLIYADAREYLQATDLQYDVIFSEPSNPYRAGVASLFTREFYRAASRSLTESGIFIQWLQAYEVDSQVVRTAYATLASVFPHVETWQVNTSDLLLLAANEPVVHDLERIERQVAREPYRSALPAVWGVSGVEGFYSGFVASAGLTRAIAQTGLDPVNTDDRPVIEYGFARTVGRRGRFHVADLRRLAQLRGEDRPQWRDGELDPDRLAEAREVRSLMFGFPMLEVKGADAARDARARARAAWSRGELVAAARAWDEQESQPEQRVDLVLLAEGRAEAGDERAPEAIERLRAVQPTEAEAVRARWALRTGDVEAATDHLVEAFRRYRTDPWPMRPVMERALLLAREMGGLSEAVARRLFDALEEPFVVRMFEHTRQLGRVALAQQADFRGLCVEAVGAFEPFVPWRSGFLTLRRDCYDLAKHPLAGRAQADLADFHARGELPLWWGILPQGDAARPELEITPPPEATRTEEPAEG